MATVREWFDDFAKALTERSGREDFPEPGSEFWDDFERSLRRMGATWPLADEAASIVCDVPDLWPNQFRPKVVEAIKKLQARQADEERAHSTGATSLDAARLASRDCPDCLGSGGAPRYVHAEILGKVRTHGGSVAPIGARVVYPCSCPLGGFVAAGLQQPGQPSRPLTVGQYPSLRLRRVDWPTAMPDGLDNQFRHHPDDWNDLDGRPAEPQDRSDSIQSLRALAASLRAPRPPGSPIYRGAPHEPQGEPARPLPGRPGLAERVADPVIARELGLAAPVPAPAQPATPEQPQPPESSPDERALDGWF